MSENHTIDRREAIRQASLFLGFAISGPALTGVLGGCSVPRELDWEPQFLTKDEAFLIEAASARILPSGETPGAKDADVVRFIDQMAAEYYLPEDQLQFRSGMEDLEAKSLQIAGKSFVEASKSEQDTVISELALEARKQRMNQPDSSNHFFLMLKELTVLGFFTSEIGATQVLNYDDVPGDFQGCEPLEALGGKTWAT